MKLKNKLSIFNFASAIHKAIDLSMKNDKKVILFGEGIDDPSAMFGTTKGFKKKYGSNRVIEMPLSENAFIGAAIGSAIMGDKVIVNLQRVEFALLAMEQIINNAAKTCYLSGGKHHVPIVIRLIVGRGWGQGPEHSQTLESLFSAIPGLKVFMPAFPNEAFELMKIAIKDPNPVIFIENRWCHYSNEKKKKIKINVKKSFYKMNSGKNLTLISSGYSSSMAYGLIKILNKFNIKIDFFNLNVLRPLNTNDILKSVKKTKKIIIIDSGHKILGMGSEILSRIAENKLPLTSMPIRLGMPDNPTPSSRAFINKIYPNRMNLFGEICKQIKIEKTKKNKIIKILRKEDLKIPLDVPNPNFKGPF